MMDLSFKNMKIQLLKSNRILVLFVELDQDVIQILQRYSLIPEKSLLGPNMQQW